MANCLQRMYHVGHIICYGFSKTMHACPFMVLMQVTPWPRKDYGKFHVADSYIVLHSHRMHELTQVFELLR